MKLNAVNTQGSAHRGGSEVDQSFIELYNKEFHSKRPLPNIEPVATDIVLQENSAFTIAQLKIFLGRQEVKVNGEEEEELIGDETDVIRLKKIEDEQGNRVLNLLCR